MNFGYVTENGVNSNVNYPVGLCLISKNGSVDRFILFNNLHP